MDTFSLETYLANAEAERAVIGAILVEPELMEDCFLKAEHFFDSKHRNIFYTMRDLESKGVPIDLIAIVERVGQNKVDKIGGMSYLMELVGSVPTTANFIYYQGLVISYHEKRQQYDIAKMIMQETPEKDASEVREAAIEALMALDENGDDDQDDSDIKGILLKVFDWMEQDHGSITGAATGFIELDKMLSGLQKQDLIIIGARPSMGKTAFAVNICQNYAMAENGGPAAIFSLEMPREGLVKRMISCAGNIDAQKMRNPMGHFVDDDWTKTSMAVGSLGKTRMDIFDKSGVDVGYIRKKCRWLKRKYPGEHIIVVIDYLQLIIGNPKHGGNRTAEIGEISRQLKHIARELDITVIALSQLSRGVEQRQDKRPMMSDLRESGQIEQDADVIAFLYRDDYYDKESAAKNITEVIVAKQRNGPIGTVSLAFIKEYNKFVNLEKRFN